MSSKEVLLTEEEIDIIEQNYLIKSDVEISNLIGKTSGQVKKYRYKYGFIKQRQTFMGDVGENNKWCWYCSEVHNKEMFSKNSRKKDGLQDECKIAVKKICLERKLRKKEEKTIIHKVCFKCGIDKSVDFYIKNCSSSDGYSNKCKECMNSENIKPRFTIKGGNQ